MEEKTLSEKVHKWKGFYNEKDVKQFIKEILDEIEKKKLFYANKIEETTFNILDELKQIIKQKSGFEDIQKLNTGG